ncbi:hypothetical protein [Paracraurococcus lichenis]|uniref:Transposase n=1 Tax=Paracraurococcus lichenis TaxID=3064888 RepID=A0ABT9EDN6_9PROT|nr:hypothetical protein [Paracraurococcus sp. LOR1-02]MDO9714324.1 hypothetical protein [Paracraurococcus sp. LOR1-02]
MELLETLLQGLRSACAAFPDQRRGEVTYSMADIGLSAFSLFFMQSESFLAHQRALEEGRKMSNCHSLFGMTAIPTDNHIRAMLDPVHPSYLQPAFDQSLDILRQRGGLRAFQRLGGRVLIALDGTEYFCSHKLGCPQYLTRRRGKGKTENYHAMLAATVVAPGHAMALPLMPEFIAPQDGAEKQDCERNAAKRWLAAHARRLIDLRPVVLGDDLFACQPIAAAIRAAGGDFLLTAKPTSHKALYDFMQGATLDEYTLTQKAKGKRLTYRFRWFEGAPLRDGPDAMLANWIGITVTDAKGQVTYSSAFVTSLPVTRDTVAEIVACARGEVEDRERELQRPQMQRLPPRAQLRPRQAEPCHDVRRHEPARLRVPYGVRLPRSALDRGQIRQTGAHALLRAHPNHHGLSRLPRLVDAHADPDRLKAAAPCRGSTRTMMSVLRYGHLELLPWPVPGAYGTPHAQRRRRRALEIRSSRRRARSC